MKLIFSDRVFVCCFLLLFAGISFQNYASHYQASNLTYICIAPNVYQATLVLYRDCSGQTLNSTEQLNIRSMGCNNGRAVPLNQVANPQGVQQFGNPYCGSQTQSPCTSSSPANYETRYYQNSIVFSALERNCANWLLSVRLGNRPLIENLANATTTYLYTEAYLNLSDIINNNSAVFASTNVPVPYVCVFSESAISLNASDPDGDSLSYELSRPLNNYNDPIPYALNNNTGNGLPQNASNPQVDVSSGNCYVYNTNVLPSCANLYKSSPTDLRPLPLQTAILPASFCNNPGTGQGQPYSVTSPLPVRGATIDWLSGCKTNFAATPAGFYFDHLTGLLRFTPTVYHPNTPPADGRNKYAIAVQVNEWRKVNGTIIKVGHIRRDMLVIVNQCNNTLPSKHVPAPAPVYGAAVSDTVMDVLACTTTRIMLKFEDPDKTPVLQLLNVSFPDAQLLSSGSYFFPSIPGLLMKPYTNNRNQVNAVFYITPDVADIGRNFFLRVIVEDNACPLKGRSEYIYRIHINNSNNRLYPVNDDRDRTIALGSSTSLNMVYMRPDSILQAPANYNFRWSDRNGNLPNGMDSWDRNNNNVTVWPTQTTRYFLAVTSQLNGCLDTSSVLVRIGNPSGISKAGQTTGFAAFPNPFSNEISFSIDLNQKHNGQLLIYSIVGKQIDRIALPGLPFGKHIVNWPNAGKQPAGQYFARLITEKGETQTIKFTKLQ